VKNNTTKRYSFAVASEVCIFFEFPLPFENYPLRYNLRQVADVGS